MKDCLRAMRNKMISCFPPSEARYPDILKKYYKKATGVEIDFQRITNFNQYIQYLKYSDNKPYKAKLTDKYQMRSYVEKNFGEKYLPKLLGIYDDFSEINFDNLPRQFVLKCNHGSAMNLVVEDKSVLDLRKERKKFDKWLHENYAFKNYPGIEPQYKDIKPRIICEEYLGGNLIDLQVWCARGNVLFISYIDHPHGKNAKATFNEEWEKLEFVTSLPRMKRDIQKPKHLKEIVTIAKRASRNMEFLRMDFYILGNGEVKISEFTFTPANGMVGWYPKSANEMIYKMIQEIREKHE